MKYTHLYYSFGDFICVTSVQNSVMIVLGFCYAVLQAKRPSVDLFFIVKPITAENVYM